jgi:hypothetical protein
MAHSTVLAHSISQDEPVVLTVRGRDLPVVVSGLTGEEVEEAVVIWAVVDQVVLLKKLDSGMESISCHPTVQHLLVEVVAVVLQLFSLWTDPVGSPLHRW